MSIVTAIAGALLFFLFIGPLCVSAFVEIKKTIAEYRLRKPRKEDYVYQQKYTNLFVDYNRLKHDLDEANEKITRYEISALKGDQENYNLTMQNKELREQNQNLINENTKLVSQIQAIQSESQAQTSPLYSWVKEAEQAKEVAKKILPKAFLGEDWLFQYAQSMSTTRLERALSEEMQFKIPFDLSTTIYSTSGEIYTTSLTSCTCEDFRRKDHPCKHMIALAIKAKALSPYTAKLQFLIEALDARVRRATETEQKTKAYQKEARETKKLLEEKQQTYPWLASLIASYTTAKYNNRINPTSDKKKMIAALKKSETERAKLSNQLAVYQSLSPYLEKINLLTPDQLSALIESTKNSPIP